MSRSFRCRPAFPPRHDVAAAIACDLQGMLAEGVAMLPQAFTAFGDERFAAVSADDRVYVWWLGLDEEGAHWCVHVTLAVEWHPFATWPCERFKVARQCVLPFPGPFDADLFAALTAEAIAAAEAIVAEANTAGYLAILDKDPHYTGPRIVKSVRIAPDPDLRPILADAFTAE